MKSHELARQLLAENDVEVWIETDEHEYVLLPAQETVFGGKVAGLRGGYPEKCLYRGGESINGGRIIAEAVVCIQG